jgi:hypothetical protein
LAYFKFIFNLDLIKHQAGGTAEGVLDYLKPLLLPTTKFLAYLPRIRATGKATPKTTNGAILLNVLAVIPQTLARKSAGTWIKDEVGIFISF